MLPLIEEVNSFCREYIDVKDQRTPERNEKIKAAYRELTGKSVRGNCGTCLIEALLTINKLSKMGVCNYHLKDTPGHTGRLTAFGNYSKNCTNKNLTNELAEWHLRVNPGCAKRFDRMPTNAPVTTAGVRIVEPKIVPPVEAKVQEPEKPIVILPDLQKDEVKKTRKSKK
jgi:hypothetical protein